MQSNNESVFIDDWNRIQAPRGELIHNWVLFVQTLLTKLTSALFVLCVKSFHDHLQESQLHFRKDRTPSYQFQLLPSRYCNLNMLGKVYGLVPILFRCGLSAGSKKEVCLLKVWIAEIVKCHQNAFSADGIVKRLTRVSAGLRNPSDNIMYPWLVANKTAANDYFIASLRYYYTFVFSPRYVPVVPTHSCGEEMIHSFVLQSSHLPDMVHVRYRTVYSTVQYRTGTVLHTF